MHLITMGIREIEAYLPIPGEACLSIAFADKSCAANLKPGWSARYHVYFDDCTPDRRGAVGSAVEITTEQAVTIVRWARRLHMEEDVKRLVINCFAGVSRSTSVACALTDAWGWAYPQRLPSAPKNRPVYEAILFAAKAEQSR